MTAVLLRLLAPAHTAGRLASIAVIVTFAVGASLASVWLTSVAPLWMLILAVFALTALATAAATARSASRRALARVPLVVMHLFWLYIVLSLGTVLAWAPPPAIRWLAAHLFLALGDLFRHQELIVDEALGSAVDAELGLGANFLSYSREQMVLHNGARSSPLMMWRAMRYPGPFHTSESDVAVTLPRAPTVQSAQY